MRRITAASMLGCAFMPIVFVFIFVFYGPSISIWSVLGFWAIYMIIGVSYLFRNDIKPLIRLIYSGIWIAVSMPLIFSLLYAAAEIQGKCILGLESLWEALYFSYVSFTTLGYGDLQPVGICRAFAALEAVVGYISLGGFVGAVISYFSVTEQANNLE